MHKNQQYAVISLMLLGLLIYDNAQSRLFEWIVQELRVGDWACALNARSGAGAGSPLTGIEGRFLWSASLLSLLVTLGLLLAVSTYSLLQRLPRLASAIALPLMLGGLLWLLLGGAPADHQQFMRLADGPECAFDSEPVFLFSRYLLLIFQPVYQSGTLDFLSHMDQLIPRLLDPCNLLLTAGLLATVWLPDPASCTLEGLAARIARYRLQLLLAAALFTVIALYNMSEFNWFAQVLATTDSEGAAHLRGLQRGLTLYTGTVNSLALALFFLPTGWLLSRQASALSERMPGLDNPQAREEWLTRHGLKIFSGPLAQLGTFLTPLLVSGALMLLQRALGA